MPVPSLNPLSTHNAIPFTMYSTGNIMTMPQTHNMSQAPVNFPLLPMQGQPQQHGVPAPGNMANSQGQFPVKPQHPQGQPMGGNMVLSRSSSPAPGAKPPCLHCARIRQENLFRQAQGPPGMPGNNTIQPHQPASQQHHGCHPPPAPVNNPIPLPGPTQLGPIPRSTPAGGLGQLTNAPRQPPNQYQPATQFPGPAPFTSPGGRISFTPPNLLQDIAQTVQASFPYAQVAARHGTAPARVAELLSNVVVAPLLRGNGRLPGAG
jgi:hypothetical protein